MTNHSETDFVVTAVFRGGPMDGREHSIGGKTDELCVVITDGQQHGYVRADDPQVLPNGRSRLIVDWTGRYYGPK